MATAWAEAPAPAKVQVGFRGTFDKEVFRSGDVAFATASLVKSWGWNLTLRGEEAQISAEGRFFRVPTREHQGRLLIDLTESARFLGAKAWWDQDTFRMMSAVRDVQLTPNGLRIDATLNFSPRLTRLKSPDRLVLDLRGASLSLPEVPTLPHGWRLAQFAPDTVRLVIEHPSVASMRLPTLTDGRLVAFTVPAPALTAKAPPQDVTVTQPGQTGGNGAGFTVVRQGEPNPEDPNSTVPPQPETNPAAGPANMLGLPQFGTETENGVTITIPTERPLTVTPSVRYLSANEIEVAIRGTQVASLVDMERAGATVAGFRVTSSGPTGLVQLRTKLPMAFSIGLQNGRTVIRLFRPQGIGNRRIVVLDPGHGGRDSGATTAGVMEKSIVLAVGLEARRQLEAEGFSVIMTRSTDVFIPLGDRPRIANESGAAVFISIHANSNRQANSRAGKITFYHQNEADGRLLAQCIHDELLKTTNIPNIGIWSDRRIYNSGFKVLRDSRVPSILLELGFVNHRSDRAEMTKPDFAARAARAIVRGIRVFLGEASPEPASSPAGQGTEGE